MDFRPSEAERVTRQAVREFAEREIAPHVMAWDEAQAFPLDLVPRLAALGLLGIQFPERYGGAGLTAVEYCICIEELARVDPAVALTVAAHNGLAAAPHRHVWLGCAEGALAHPPGAGRDAGGVGAHRTRRWK